MTLDNLLGKPTGTARRLALFPAQHPLRHPHTPPHSNRRSSTLGAKCCWKAFTGPSLCFGSGAAASSSALPVLDAGPGASVRWPDLASAILVEYPHRYSPKMLRSLAQNCVASWTQSGHLQGRVNKRRRMADPSPEFAAYAALLGSIAGFGGPALLRSPWMRLLDRSESDLLSLLRRAESRGVSKSCSRRWGDTDRRSPPDRGIVGDP